MNRKGMTTGAIITLILLLIVLVILAVQIGESGKRFSNTTATFQTCGATSLTDGRCVANKQACDALGGNFWENMGCKGSTPYCCTNIPSGGGGDSSTGDLTAPFGNCTYSPKNTWTDKERCRVSMESASVEITSTGGASTKFSVTCTANRNAVPCFLSPTFKKDASAASVFPDDSKPKEFPKDKPYAKFYYWTNNPGTYTVTCSLDPSKCNVEPESEAQALAEFKIN